MLPRSSGSSRRQAFAEDGVPLVAPQGKAATDIPAISNSSESVSSSQRRIEQSARSFGVLAVSISICVVNFALFALRDILADFRHVEGLDNVCMLSREQQGADARSFLEAIDMVGGATLHAQLVLTLYFCGDSATVRWLRAKALLLHCGQAGGVGGRHGGRDAGDGDRTTAATIKHRWQRRSRTGALIHSDAQQC